MKPLILSLTALYASLWLIAALEDVIYSVCYSDALYRVFGWLGVEW